jgi:hypothetical protein
VHAFARRAASRARARPRNGTNGDQKLGADAACLLHDKAARHQRRNSETLSHDVVSIVTTSAESMPMLSHFIKFESEPRLDADHPENGVLIPRRITFVVLFSDGFV